MAEDGELPAQSLLLTLVEALQGVSCLADLHSRNLVLRAVSDELGYPLHVVEYPQTAAHLLSIVSACRAHSGGLRALLNTLDHLEPGSVPMTAVRRIITQVTPLTIEATQPQLVAVHEDPASRPHIWGAVPLRNPDFVGREDLLERLGQRLVEPGPTALLPHALHGMGGVGKSQTVVEYIYRHAAEYDVVWWISAEQVSRVTSSFIELARRLGLPSESAEAAVSVVVDALRKRQAPFSRWLLVFDNAESPETVTPFFPPSGHIVVTSRNPQWVNVARTVEVDVFTRWESIELLRRRASDISEQDADRLADALGDLPLAVELAAAWRVQTGTPVDEHLRLLDHHLPELLDHGTAAGRQSANAVWSLSLNRLRLERPAALRLLRLCAFFGPEPISRSLLISTQDDPIALNQAVRELSRYSLAKADPRGNTIQLHRLVQAIVKSELTEAEQADVRHEVHVLLARGDPGDPTSPLTWPRYADLLPHVVNSEMSHCRRPDSAIRRLLINLARYLSSCGDFRSVQALAHRILAEWRKSLGEAHVDTLEMARRCGVSLRRLGRLHEAQALNGQTHELVRQAFGEDSELFLSISDALWADDMHARGAFGEMLAMQQDIFERSRRLFGADDPRTLRYANNLASCLRLNGKFSQARVLDKDTVRRKRVVLGPDHPSTFLSLNALAMDVRECGEWLVACQLQQDTLDRQRTAIGDDHPQTIGGMRNLAVARRLAGDYVGARGLSERCLRSYRRLHGDRHLDTITAEMSLAADLRLLGDLTESARLAKRSSDFFLEIYGNDHPYALISLVNLASAYRRMGMESQAGEIDRDALPPLRRVLGEDHPFTLACATNLANDLAAMGEFSAAHNLDKDTLERSGRVLGQKHPCTAAVALNLSVDLVQLGQVDAAGILSERTVSDLGRTIGDDHPMTSAAIRAARFDAEVDTLQL